MIRKIFKQIEDTVGIIKLCLTIKWFWIPVLYLLCLYCQLIMIVYIHILTIFIFPLIFFLYSIYFEKKLLKNLLISKREPLRDDLHWRKTLNDREYTSS